MTNPNDLLRWARQRTESPYASGDCLSRQELAELVNTWVYEHTENHRVIETDANYVGQLERGKIRWPQDPDRRAGFRAVLGVKTDAELGFRGPRRSRTIVSGVERQQFIRAGLGVGAAAMAGPATLLELLAPSQPARIPSVVSMTHVAEVNATAAEFRGWDARYGGGLMREAAVAQLRHCAGLLNAHSSEAVRRELLTAVGSFAETAGFMACDDFAHDDARRMYRFALACAEEAGDWHLRAQVLCSTAYQASWCGDPDAGLAYTESTLVRAGRLTATERAMLHNSRARDLAKLGEVQDALRAIGAADEEFSHARPAEDPPWMASYTGARHTGWAGYVLWELGMHGQFVAEARNRLTAGIVASAEDRARARARSQIKLASLIMATGDPLEATVCQTHATFEYLCPHPWPAQLGELTTARTNRPAQRRGSQYDQRQAQHAALPLWPSSRSPRRCSPGPQRPSCQAERTRTTSPSRSSTPTAEGLRAPSPRTTCTAAASWLYNAWRGMPPSAAKASSRAGTSAAGEFACRVPFRRLPGARY
ncbi:MAG: XRE family transcriptional regulator [Pseudonocardiaceae bacterium]